MGKKLKWLIIVISICLLAGAGIWLSGEFDQENNQYVSRGQASKSIALSMISKEECGVQAGESYFLEKDQKAWYVKYMDYLYNKGILDPALTLPTAKSAAGYFTYGETQQVFVQMGIDDPMLANSFLPEYKDKPIPKEAWWNLYDLVIASSLRKDQIATREIILLGTPSNLENAESWEAFTDKERLGFEGLVLDPYIDHKLEVVLSGNEIIGVLRIVDNNVTYENIWITESGNNSLQIYLNGTYRRFMVANLSGDYSKTTADLRLEDGEIVGIDLKKDIIRGKVLLVSESGIEIEGYGMIPLSENFRIYKMYGELAEQRLSEILVGYEVWDFVVAKGELSSAITREAADAAIIRVLLTNDGFQSVFHDRVTVTSKGNFTLYHGEFQDVYEPGTILELDRNNPAFTEGRLKLVPEEEFEIQISSIERTYGTPSYAGTLELALNAEGILIVNELSLESYLTKVVPSEMPVSSGLEALKVQAVCARSYGYKQIQGNAYSEFGAHVDDSTKFQVYNNIESQPLSTQAVKETYGEVITYEEKVVNAYFFSTSSGVTTDAAIWGSTPEAYPYLAGTALTETKTQLDLTDNGVFLDFIKNKEFLSFDKNATWYRWNTQISLKNLTSKISNIGAITSLEITKRGTNGVISELIIRGTGGETVLSNQSQVREVLGDPTQTITRNDGTTVTGWKNLPSGFLALEPILENDAITGYSVYGGGFGHGVGVSQNAVANMAKIGMTYKEILSFFFKGIGVSDM